MFCKFVYTGNLTDYRLPWNKTVQNNVFTAKLMHCYHLKLCSGFPQIQETVKVEQNENVEDKEMRPGIESGPFFEYLDELCNDEEFVRDVSYQWH